MTPLELPTPRIPEAARIRAGGEAKAGGGWGKRLREFRFTGNESVVRRVAEVYGGKPSRWKNEWQVETESASLGVALPPDDLAIRVSFEKYDGGGRILRRCDARQCQSFEYVEGPDGMSRETAEVPCLCQAQHEAGEDTDCDVKARLTVLVPDLMLAGTCLFTSTSPIFAAEAQGAIDFARLQQPTGSLRGRLVINPDRKSQTTGHNFQLVELHLAINADTATPVLPEVRHESPYAGDLPDNTYEVIDEPVIEEASTPPPALADIAPEAPQASKRRQKKPQTSTSEAPDHIKVLEGVTSPADGWTEWQKLILKADPSGLEALKAYWMIWSGKNPEIAQKLGKAVSQALRQREAQLRA
jgi:hypothetical protein